MITRFNWETGIVFIEDRSGYIEVMKYAEWLDYLRFENELYKLLQ